MNLLVDCGNSFIKWALVTDESAIEESRCLSVEASSLHELWKNYDTPERVIVSNVAGQPLASEIIRAAELLWQRDAEFAVSTQNCCGLSNNYQQPEQLGVDRETFNRHWRQTTLPNIRRLIIELGPEAFCEMEEEDGQEEGETTD